MTSTPRLDRLATSGTDHIFERIRLADRHMLALQAKPGAAFAEVGLFPGLEAPDTEAWENEDRWEEWLTGGTFGAGGLFVDVPIQAVRDLITQHGGEHEDQEGEQYAPDLMTRIQDLHGRFADGYTPEEINAVFGRIADEGGPHLVCVWDFADEYGFGGNSEFFAEDKDGDLFEVQPDIHLWLSGQPETPSLAGTWVGGPVTGPTEFPVTDDFHNYARYDRIND